MLWQLIVHQRQLHQLKLKRVEAFLEQDFLELKLSLLLNLENLVELTEETLHSPLVAWSLQARDV